MFVDVERELYTNNKEISEYINKNVFWDEDVTDEWFRLNNGEYPWLQRVAVEKQTSNGDWEIVRPVSWYFTNEEWELLVCERKTVTHKEGGVYRAL